MASVKMKWLPATPKHALERYFTALASLGVSSPIDTPQLHPPDSARSWAASALADRRVDFRYYVIAPGAIHPTKRAPVELWAKIAQEILQLTDARPLLVGSPDERPLLLDVVQQLGITEQSVFAESDIRHAAVVLAGANFTLSNDSGIAHLSAALDRPTLALFGPTHPILGFAPLGKRATHYSVNEYCSPCSLHGKRNCYRQERYCFTKMEPAAIVENIRTLLSQPREKSEQAK